MNEITDAYLTGLVYDDEDQVMIEDFIKSLRNEVDKIPEDYRASAYIKVDVNCYFDDPDQYVNLKIFYARPETDQEKADREYSDGQRAARERQKELKQLKELKEKYPDE